MRKTVAAGSVAVAAVAGMIPVTATAATRTPTLAQQTCTAFTAWQRHPGTARLDRLVTVSLALHRGYLAADVGQLLADSVTAKPKASYIRSDARYMGDDCAKA